MQETISDTSGIDTDTFASALQRLSLGSYMSSLACPWEVAPHIFFNSLLTPLFGKWLMKPLPMVRGAKWDFKDSRSIAFDLDVAFFHRFLDIPRQHDHFKSYNVWRWYIISHLYIAKQKRGDVHSWFWRNKYFLFFHDFGHLKGAQQCHSEKSS